MSSPSTTIETANIIATAIVAGTSLGIEAIVASYEGVMIHGDPDNMRVVHLYLCDDDGEAWMVDFCDVDSGESNPEPMTLDAMNRVRSWIEEN